MADLPRGMVTFCFTDVEGSTQLFTRLGPHFLDVLEEHRRIIRSALASHGGVEVKTEGDGFFVAFADPARAVAACVELQRALAAHEWPADGDVRVRVGLHMGPAEPADGDYVAYDVHVAARVSGAGHGGQILLTDTVERVVQRRLPDATTLIDLGEHELKDLPPMRLFQVAAPGLVGSFPPPRSVAIERGYVPAPTSSILGRDAVIAEIERHLATVRLVTVTGSGGVGKTRAATETARRALGTRRDGVWFVDLAPVTDPDLVEPTFLRALGALGDDDSSPRSRLVRYLADREALLVVDNCEHLIDPVSDLVHELLRAAAGVSVLATSREALGIEGELAVRLPSLDTQAGVELFVERAAAVGAATGAYDAEAMDAVSAVVERLDGIPLAIELAAARTKLLTPQQVLARLDDRFRLLTGGRRTAMARQRTLEATVDWSYDLLDDEERRLVQRLAVFAGGFDLEAVEAVAGAGAIDTLERLVDKSMVATTMHGGGLRHRLLETVRHYCWSKLVDAGQVDAVRDAHAAWCVARARRANHLKDDREVSEAAALTAEHDNFRAALEWTLDRGDARALDLAAHLWMFWAVTGRTAEGLAWMGRVVDAFPDADRETRALALAGWAHLTWIGQRPEAELVARVERAVALADHPTWYGAWAHLLASNTGSGDVRLAEPLHRALDLARQADDGGFVLAHTQLAHADELLEQRQEEAAMAAVEEAVATARARGSVSTLGSTLEQKAALLALVGDVGEAVAVADEAVAAARRGPNVYFLLFTLNTLGRVRRVAGHADPDAPLAEAGRIAADIGHDYHVAQPALERGWIALERGDVAVARAHFEAATVAIGRIATHRMATQFAAILAAQGLAGADLLDGRVDEARPVLAGHDAVAQAVPVPWFRALTATSMGWLELQAGDLDAACAAHRRALDEVADLVATSRRARVAAASALRGIADVETRRGDPDRAAHLLGAASELREPDLSATPLGTVLARRTVVGVDTPSAPASAAAAFREGAAAGLDAAVAGLRSTSRPS